MLQKTYAPGKWLRGLQVLTKAFICLSVKVAVRQLVFNTRFINYELKIYKPGWEKRDEQTKSQIHILDFVFKTSKLFEVRIIDFYT